MFVHRSQESCFTALSEKKKSNPFQMSELLRGWLVVFLGKSWFFRHIFLSTVFVVVVVVWFWFWVGFFFLVWFVCLFVCCE